jgi:hypothetical protein
MYKYLVLSLLILASPAYAADTGAKVLVLNAQEQQELINALDASVRSGGLNAASAAMRILYKLQTAGTMADPNQAPPADKPVPKEGPPQ